MLKKSRREGLMNKHGQNMIEYMLLFVAVIVVFFAAMRPNGFFRTTISNSLNKAVNGIGVMANGINTTKYK